MKLVFQDEVKAVIERIASLPIDPGPSFDYNEPMKLIHELTMDLYKPLAYAVDFLDAARAERIRAGQIFLTSIYAEQQKQPCDKRTVYSRVINAFKDIQTGASLTHRDFVKQAMSHGCLELSDEEITTLLQQNAPDKSHPKDDTVHDFVQVCGCWMCKENPGVVIPFVSHEKAEFYGVYLGKPGCYQIVDDYEQYSAALDAADALIKQGKAKKLDDKTFHD